jgi:hypothetical protein
LRDQIAELKELTRAGQADPRPPVMAETLAQATKLVMSNTEVLLALLEERASQAS